MHVPESLLVTKLDGIMTYEPWLTAGHVETGGDDSITYVSVGKKLVLIAKRGKAARWLESRYTSVKAIVDCLLKSSKVMKNNVRLFITDPSLPMIQPPLWSHQ